MNYYTNKILKENKITSFLEEMGMYPIKKSGDKLFYNCPIHEEEDPSFIVFPEGIEGRDYQTYHCFGCGSGINIINLKRDLNKISPTEAVKFFLKDMNIDSNEVISSIINDIINDKNISDDKKEVENLLLMINNTCREHLENYRDNEEIVFFDRVFRVVDKLSISRDIETLEGIS